MKIATLLLVMLASAAVDAADRSWLCRSIDGVGMWFEDGAWRKSTTLQTIMFELKELSGDGQMQFPEWLMMENAICTANPEVPWISCSDNFKLFVLNPATNDAMMANTGLWILKEKLGSGGKSLPSLGADVVVLRCE
jgi:hypothetical protein